MTRLKAGDMRRRIQIQEVIETANGNGGNVETWQVVPGCTSVPARFVYPPPAKKGDTDFVNQQRRTAEFVTITIRYRPSQNIDASMRIVYGTRTFVIRTVLPVDELQQQIDLQCEELQGKGSLHT